MQIETGDSATLFKRDNGRGICLVLLLSENGDYWSLSVVRGGYFIKTGPVLVSEENARKVLHHWTK